ncbi:MAG: hypothetical protein WC322_00305 [Candidatus Paceibacterota bacterium]|jgi:hypothetical protein
MSMKADFEQWAARARASKKACLSWEIWESAYAAGQAFEREECAKVCEYRTEQSSDHPVLAALAEGAKGCAAAIRARSTP